MKGQSELISHTIFIAFMVMMIIVIVTGMNNIKKDYSDYIGKQEIKQVCYMVRDAVDKIYDNDSYALQNTEEMGSFVINLPDRIADANYRVEFNSTNVTVKTTDEPLLSYSCSTGFDITFAGSAAGGRTEIKRTGYSNGSTTIEMRKL